MQSSGRMKAGVVFLGLIAAIGAAHCSDASSKSNIAEALEQAVGKDIQELVSMAMHQTSGKGGYVPLTRRKDEDKDVRVAARYIVAPNEAKNFIDIFEKQKDSALEQDGTVEYRLFKTIDDNVTFLFAGVWKSYEDLVDHLKSDSTIKFLKDLADLRVVFKTTQVIEVATGKGRHHD